MHTRAVARRPPSSQIGATDGTESPSAHRLERGWRVAGSPAARPDATGACITRCVHVRTVPRTCEGHAVRAGCEHGASTVRARYMRGRCAHERAQARYIGAAEGRGCPPRTVSRIPEPRQFRWARSAWFRVHLTRDDRTCQAMFQALALASIGSRKYKTHANATDESILRADLLPQGAPVIAKWSCVTAVDRRPRVPDQPGG